MSTLAIDTYKLLTALKGTGKSANFTAEEIANAVDVAQERAELLTRPVFEARMATFEARMNGFDAKLEVIRSDIKAEVKASQLQNVFWLSGIMLASNGIVIALLARLAHVI
ncbi:MAG TPA: hypothetical protein VFO53_15130 [Casimicrobiaceae bacterium]|nr:hypothetical protein [Casimicrobiaceae bacterium]